MPMRTEYLGFQPDLFLETDPLASIADQESMVRPGDVVLVSGLAPGEPIFVLRAADATAVAILSIYSTMVEGLFSDAKAIGLEEIRQAFVDWQRGHRALVKLPD